MIGQLKKIGVLLQRSNLARNIAILKLYERVRIGTVIFDEDMKEIGKIIEIFGPTISPYARVLLNETTEKFFERFKGKTCFVIVGEEEKVRWRKMPRPRKGRVE